MKTQQQEAAAPVSPATYELEMSCPDDRVDDLLAAVARLLVLDAEAHPDPQIPEQRRSKPLPKDGTVPCPSSGPTGT